MSTTCEEVALTQNQDVPDLIPARMLNEFAYCPRLAYLEWVQGEFTDNLDTIEGRFGHRRVDEPSRADVPEAGERAAESATPFVPQGVPPGPSSVVSTGEERPSTPGLGTGGSGLDASGATLGATGLATAGKPQSPDANPPSTIPNPPETIHTRSLMLSAPGEGLIAKMDLVDIRAGVAIPIDYKHGRVPDVPGNAWEPEQVQLCVQGLILRENGYLCEGGILYYVESRRRVSVPFSDALIERYRAS